jgi:hypothetical protein
MKNFYSLIILLFLGNFLPAQDTIMLNPSSPGLAIPPAFTGIAYETGAVHYDSIRPGNHTLINFFKTIGVKNFRIGGNSVESYIYINGNTHNTHPYDTITQNEIDSLFLFADAVGCKVIFDLDFGGHFDPSLAAQEATYIMQRYTSQLLSFEIGNEPNLYYEGLRSSAYNYDSFLLQYRQYVDTIRKYNPAAPVLGPSAAQFGAAEYTNPFAHEMKDTICMLTQHYYVMAANPGNIGSEIVKLLKQSTLQTITSLCDTLVMRADSDNISFRMDENNAIWTPGGQWGVSNSLAAALWALDYMYSLAQVGVSGVNFHSPHDMPATIISHNSGNYSANALYYGILAFQYGSKGNFIPLQKKGNAQNMNSYAVLDSMQNIYLTIINKDTLNAVPVLIDAGTTYNSAGMVSLSATAVSDTFGITLAGAQVQANGKWTPASWQTVNYTGNYFTLTVPAAAAIILKLNSPTVAIENISPKQIFSIFPNPSSDKISLETPKHSRIEIYNIQGQLIKIDTPNGNKINIDVTAFQRGVYLVKVRTEKGVMVRKFIKE